MRALRPFGLSTDWGREKYCVETNSSKDCVTNCNAKRKTKQIIVSFRWQCFRNYQ